MAELQRNHPGFCGFLTGNDDLGPTGLAPQMRQEGYLVFKEVGLKRLNPAAERRKWPRLPIAIPVFVRSRDEKGKEILEFATALNISAGGALVAVRRSLPLSTQVLLEIPSAPLAVTNSLPKAARNLRARTLRVTHAEGYHLVGLKFSHPLVGPPASLSSRPRKASSAL
jgi:PilZ domain-containing protein